jgi:hypothetical protein
MTSPRVVFQSTFIRGNPPMKMIVAIIRPEKLEAVQQALNDRDVYLMTVSDVRGCGRAAWLHRSLPWHGIRGPVASQT